jgi:hypothetical protein
MSNQFQGYGESSEPMSPWCSLEDFSIEHIEELAAQAMENFKDCDTVYLSHDLYHKLQHDLYAKMCYPPLPINGNQVIAVVTCIGVLVVKQVPTFSNFCYTGTLADYEKLMWINIDKDFEEIILSEEYK